MSFDYDTQIESIKQQIATKKQNTPRTKWLLHHLKLKILGFPQDFALRQRLSRYKRLKRKGATAPPRSFASRLLGRAAPPSGPFKGAGTAQIPPFHVTALQKDRLNSILEADPGAVQAMAEMEQFLKGPQFDALVEKARALDPTIGTPAKFSPGLFPPWHDDGYHSLAQLKKSLPQKQFDTIIMMPFGKLGGADFVAGVLSKVTSETDRVLILRTEQSDWERPDWFPAQVDSVDISGFLDRTDNPARALYVVMQHLKPQRIYNVNSRRCFEMYVAYGQRLAGQFDLFAYYFCSDRDPNGVEAGYPVMFMTNVLPHLRAAQLDSRFLYEVLTTRYAMDPHTAAKLNVVYTPAMTAVSPEPMSKAQIATKAQRPRPVVLWAGRFDKQKRFDLLVEVAKRMPQIDFKAWGKAVLDKPPKLKKLPSNLQLNAPFKSYSELPLEHSDGWLYTAAWDGLPTILIECAAMGVPIAASAVGGVPELIDETTGWPVRDPDNVEAYVAAVTAMLGSDEERLMRTSALQDRIRTRHSTEAYKQAIAASQAGA